MSNQRAWTYLWWRVLIGLALLALPLISEASFPLWPKVGWVAACVYMTVGWCRVALIEHRT